MTEEQQRIAIAEASGWVNISKFTEYSGATQLTGELKSNVDKGIVFPLSLPDYLNDLNTMHAAWSILGAEQRVEFEAHLYDIIVGLGEFHSSEDRPYITNATAALRAEAFLKTLNLWKDND